LRLIPHVSLSFFDGDDWERHVTLLGRIVSIAADADLHDIDRLAARYTGAVFGTRDRKRVSAWMLPERWSSWPLPKAGR
jgi:hypothetical protein